LFLTKRPDIAKMVWYPELQGWKNIWLGVTAENQQRANERIPKILELPAPVHFVSVEPMLEPIDMTEAIYGPEPRGMNAFGFTDGFGYEAFIEWVICGAETGPSARLLDLEWARDLRDQCKSAGVPFFFKKAGNKKSIPDDLMIREYPNNL
jgi:protein gp37